MRTFWNAWFAFALVGLFCLLIYGLYLVGKNFGPAVLLAIPVAIMWYVAFLFLREVNP